MSPSKRVAIVGVTGFIGRDLPILFARRGLRVTGISRRSKARVAGVDRWQPLEQPDFSGHHAIINLAGEPVNQRWTPENRLRFHESRVVLTRKIVRAIGRLPENDRPQVLVNGSAVGYYGDRGDEMLDETTSSGTGYLADLCREWEEAAFEAQALGTRVVTLRTGVVLGKGGAAFEQLARVFRLGIGGRLGHGRQWMPWIHVDDLREAMVHAVFSPALSGPVNGAAPQPERNAAFTRKFAAAVHRPAIFPVPAFALKLVLGDFSSALLASQRVVSAVLERDGFSFRYPTLESALSDLAA